MCSFIPRPCGWCAPSLRLIDDKLRNDPEANRLFLEILTSRQQPELPCCAR